MVVQNLDRVGFGYTIVGNAQNAVVIFEKVHLRDGIKAWEEYSRNSISRRPSRHDLPR